MFVAVDVRRLRTILGFLLLAAGAVAVLWSEMRHRPRQVVAPALHDASAAGAASIGAIYRGPAELPWAALAINVDWGEEVLPEMLAVLRWHGVRATFFLTGRWARKFPDVARLIAEGGHEIGNHGLDHLHPTELADAELHRLVEENARLLESLTGRRPTLFAPPYGEVDERVVRVARSAGHYTVMWTVDTIDWQRPAPDVILDRVGRRLAPGAIILMHPTQPALQALPDMLRLIAHRGLMVVPVGQMVEALEHGGVAGPGVTPDLPGPSSRGVLGGPGGWALTRPIDRRPTAGRL